MRFLAFVGLLSVLPQVALANGGPLAWTLRGGTGTLAPLDETRVGLVSEQLSIRLDDDGQRYHARAAYVLSNPGAPVTVKYGVPVFWLEEGLDVEPGPTPGGAAVTDVAVTLAGERHGCTVEDARWLDPKHPGLGAVAWCTTTLTIPTGEAVSLGLDLHGWLRFTDMGFSKSVFTVFGERVFRYELAPAGHWAGRPALSIELDPGRWGDRFTVSAPAGFERRDGRLVFTSKAADLEALEAITGALAAAPVLGAAQRWKAKAIPGAAVRTSSTLAPQGRVRYDASNLLDGDPATAWCPARAAKGPHWIELTVPATPGCWAELVLVPGYAKSQAAWTANGRLRALRRGACGSPVPATLTFSLPAFAHHDEAAVDLGNVEPRGTTCIRFELGAVDPGTSGDTCLSELKPVLSCG